MRKAIVLAAVLSGAAVHASTTTAAPSPKLGMRAPVLTRVDDTTWKGRVASPQLGSGQLTLTGRVGFRVDGVPTSSVLRFRATFRKGWIRGCIHNFIVLRPGNRQVWDGSGQITSTSRSLRRYRGLKGHDGGQTMADDLDHTKPFSFGVPGFPQDANADTSC
jgi:hypothetical protein